MSSGGYCVGFVSSRADNKDFLAWDDRDYFAGYKVMYDDKLMETGTSTETRGLSLWGSSRAELDKIASWSDQVRRGVSPDVPRTNHADIAKVVMIQKAFGER